MEIRMDGKKAPTVSGIEPVLAEIQQRLQTRPKEWLEVLQANPGAFADLEKEIHHAFGQMADRVAAGLLAQATAPAEFTEAAKKK